MGGLFPGWKRRYGATQIAIGPMSKNKADTAALVTELQSAARAFAKDERDASKILKTMAADVERAMGEALTIFPVIHHSPASAVHMVRYLRDRQPRLVLIEMCEDLLPLVEDLRDCSLPVALQAFSGTPKGFPDEWAPLSVVAPITELSAEYQAIAYALSTEGVELAFVDRSVDHVCQWQDPMGAPSLPTDEDIDLDNEEEDAARMHGGAIGIEVGGVTPSFRDFRDFLLQNARMSHFSEWMSLYVESPTIGADTTSYREVLCMVGSLFRRLGTTSHDREEIRNRDRFMWTRIKETLRATKVAPKDAVFLCGAAHIVNDEVPEWGLHTDTVWEEIPAATGTQWQYGFIPSSYGAIEMQFGHPRGAVSLAEAEWKKAIKRWKLSPYTLGKKKSEAKKAKRKEAVPEQLSLRSVLRDAPPLGEADEAVLIAWCSGIVSSARKNRYMASTADAIAIYETSILLARMRARHKPSPYDFIDAAETCLEKMRVPGRHNIRELCHRLLGGDRMGQVGYSSLPPLMQDVYDRLACLGISAKTRTVKRVLMDFAKAPETRAASKLLWRLQWMLPDTRVARPIMGELTLGAEPRQESWDVRMHGPEQRAVIQLSFEGISVEQVLEGRLHQRAFAPKSKTLDALETAEACVLLLEKTRLFSSLGERAVALLAAEAGPDDSIEIFQRVRRLVHHFRGTAEGVPAWLEHFVATGYSHYATLLPKAFSDRGTSPEQLAAMLSFVFTLESLAIAMGCERSELLIAIEQAGPGTAAPEKLGLLWATEFLVQLRDERELREAFIAILEHPIGRNAYPQYLSGFMQGIAFAPRIAALSVELLGRAFEALPDIVLLPWMPNLLATLEPLGPDVIRGLLAEFTRDLPRSYDTLEKWEAPWMIDVGAAKAASRTATANHASPQSEVEGAAHALLRAHDEALDAIGATLGVMGEWTSSVAPPQASGVQPKPGGTGPSLAILEQYGDCAAAWARLLS